MKFRAADYICVECVFKFVCVCRNMEGSLLSRNRRTSWHTGRGLAFCCSHPACVCVCVHY